MGQQIYSLKFGEDTIAYSNGLEASLEFHGKPSTWKMTVKNNDNTNTFSLDAFPVSNKKSSLDLVNKHLKSSL